MLVDFYDDRIAQQCVYGADFVREILGVKHLYAPNKEFSLSSRKVQGYKRIAKYRKYYQENPVRFIRDFFNIQLIDSQSYIIQSMWNTQNVLLVASRAYGKSFLVVLFIMSKQMLSSYPWNCYIASGSGQQSATTFKKLEDIANDRISSLLNSTGSIFKNEVEINAASGDGFSHNPAGFTYNLFNGAFTMTLNSSVDKNRGARADCVIFDECGFLPADLIKVYEAFCAVEKGFKTGVNDDGSDMDYVHYATLPKEIPNQLIYVSSASSTDTEFYRLYVEFTKKMIIGDPNYFVAHIDCDLVMNPTVKGKPMKSALTQDKIDTALKTNPEKARREYYCEFTSDAGKDAIIRRSMIARNEEVRRPLLYNDTGEKKFFICYDPARMTDNSVVLVGEVYFEKNKGYEARIVNCITLFDYLKKDKKPMNIPNQINALREIILDYNQGGDEHYSNILGVYIDAGSGGQALAIADFLRFDWTDSNGELHRGLIDKKYSGDEAKMFPEAIDKVKLLNPGQYKADMYEALIQMITENHLKFTATYDNKGYLTIVNRDEKKVAKIRKDLISKHKNKGKTDEEINQIIENEITKSDIIDTQNVRLDIQDEAALGNIDSLKEELVNMVRIKKTGTKDSFELAPEKRNRIHDDKAYVTAMLGYALYQTRREESLRSRKQKKNTTSSLIDLLYSNNKKATRKYKFN